MFGLLVERQGEMSRHKLRLRKDAPDGPIVGQYPSFRSMLAEITLDLSISILKQRTLTLFVIERAANEQEVYLGTLSFAPGDQAQDEYRALLQHLIRTAETSDVVQLLQAIERAKSLMGKDANDAGK